MVYALLTAARKCKSPAMRSPVLTRGKTGLRQPPPDKKHGHAQKSSGINAASRDLGIERTEAQRAVKIARLLDEVKKAAKEAKLDDNQSALLHVAAQPSPEAQLAAIRDGQRGGQVGHCVHRRHRRQDRTLCSQTGVLWALRVMLRTQRPARPGALPTDRNRTERRFVPGSCPPGASEPLPRAD
jgi:hypothetical protein